MLYGFHQSNLSLAHLKASQCPGSSLQFERVVMPSTMFHPRGPTILTPCPISSSKNFMDSWWGVEEENLACLGSINAILNKLPGDVPLTGVTGPTNRSSFMDKTLHSLIIKSQTTISSFSFFAAHSSGVKLMLLILSLSSSRPHNGITSSMQLWAVLMPAKD